MLSQGGKLEWVNLVFSSSPMFHMATLKLHNGIITQLNKYMKHCLWRGSDLSSRKPSKAAWPMVCLPKQQGGLGVINLNSQNEALLLKFLHKFFTRADIPWVHLVWDNYYNNGKLPGQNKEGSFWWKNVVKLLDKYKGIASAWVSDGSTVLFWMDTWNEQVLFLEFPQLFSFARNKLIS